MIIERNRETLKLSREVCRKLRAVRGSCLELRTINPKLFVILKKENDDNEKGQELLSQRCLPHCGAQISIHI